jgi:hypothetical protein
MPNPWGEEEEEDIVYKAVITNMAAARNLTLYPTNVNED